MNEKEIILIRGAIALISFVVSMLSILFAQTIEGGFRELLWFLTVLVLLVCAASSILFIRDFRKVLFSKYDDLMPPSKIANLSQGMFCDKFENNNQKIKDNADN